MANAFTGMDSESLRGAFRGWLVFHDVAILAAVLLAASTNLALKKARVPGALGLFCWNAEIATLPSLARRALAEPETIMNVPILCGVVAAVWGSFPIRPTDALTGFWVLFGVYWLLSAIGRKKTKKRESWLQRIAYILPLLIGFRLAFRPEARYGWLGTRFVPDTLTVAWLGVAITAAGVGVAFWARYHLGANWSGTVTLKENHELIRTGPYGTIRHPIYTGILLALFGSVITLGEVCGLIGLGVVWLSFYIKARREESFLAEEFGPRFAEHQRHTGMFLPRFS